MDVSSGLLERTGVTSVIDFHFSYGKNPVNFGMCYLSCLSPPGVQMGKP
jgi:hypothetical protein